MISRIGLPGIIMDLKVTMGNLAFYKTNQLIDLTQHGDIFFLKKEFKAPPRDSAGSADRAKKVLRTYYPDAFSEPKKEDTTVHCPFCGYHEFTLLNRGYSIFTGFLGSDKVKRICNRCKMQF